VYQKEFKFLKMQIILDYNFVTGFSASRRAILYHITDMLEMLFKDFFPQNAES
jgi:hypothetical protein